MARKYQSLPHKIDAFRFTKKDREFPDWFNKAVRIDKAQVTTNGDVRYISIYGKEQTEKAYHLDWVCLSADGKLYVLDDKTFNKYYKINQLSKLSKVSLWIRTCFAVPSVKRSSFEI